MRLLYASPRHENIDRVIVLMTAHGIAPAMSTRADWNPAGRPRFF